MREGIDSMNNKVKKNGFIYNIKKYKEFYIMMIPGLLFLVIFRYIPMGGVILAFKEYYPWLGFAGSEWVGLKNFELFVQSSYFWQLFRNTIIISTYKIIFGFPAPLILAILLNELRSNKFKRTVQTITYFPHFLSWVLIYTLMINVFDQNMGLLNDFLANIGLDRIPFLARATYIRSMLVVTNIWKNVGWGSIVYLAAISGINPQLYEAAEIDGANRWQKMFRITLPSICPTIAILLILRIGRILYEDFQQILMFAGENQILLEVTQTYEIFVYRVLQEGIFPLSYGVAVGLFQGVFGMCLVLISNWYANNKLGYRALW